MNQAVKPPVEFKETAESLVLRSMLPGCDRDKLNIEVTREAVLISGTYPQPELPKKSQYFRSEFPQGQFRRVVSLPFAVDHTAVKANYEHGILTLTLPKAPELINKVVKVPVLHASQPASEIATTTSDTPTETESEQVDNPWNS